MPRIGDDAMVNSLPLRCRGKGRMGPRHGSSCAERGHDRAGLVGFKQMAFSVAPSAFGRSPSEPMDISRTNGHGRKEFSNGQQQPWHT